MGVDPARAHPCPLFTPPYGLHGSVVQCYGTSVLELRYMATLVHRKRDLLTLEDISLQEMQQLFGRARELKRNAREHTPEQTLRGKTLGMIFEKSSTRTRVSFEVGMFQLGGQALFLSSREMQLGRGETLEDSARVLSRYLDCLMVRTYAHEKVEILAQHATVPVINGLSDSFHPCQVLADLLTYEEQRGSIAGRRVAWVGDGNNMANTWIQAAARTGCRLVLACPSGYEPDGSVLGHALQTGADVAVVADPVDAVTGADLVVTDTWTSMGQEEDRQQRLQAFRGYQVDHALMAHARPDALFMHCLPAHRGEEVSEDVLDGAQSVVWEEAENRLHIQKAILEWLIGTDRT